MSEKQFPNIAFKLSAPAKKTQYERKKAEDEAKRLRNEAEDAEAIAKLVAEFADSDDGDEPDPTTQQPTSSDMGGHKAHGHGFTPNVQPRRHRAPGAMKMSGPGTLGPLPGSDLSRKRGRDDGNDGENAEERYTYGGREYQNSNESASPSSGENSGDDLD
jgi:U2-associated protein SR140